MDFEKQLKKLARKRNFWWGFALVLVGIVIGYMIAPAKKGMRITNVGNIKSWKEPEEVVADVEGIADLEALDGVEDDEAEEAPADY